MLFKQKKYIVNIKRVMHKCIKKLDMIYNLDQKKKANTIYLFII